MREHVPRLSQIARKAAGEAHLAHQGPGPLRLCLVLQQPEHIQAAQHALPAARHQHAAVPRQQAYSHVHPPGRTLFFVYGQKRRIALARGVAQAAPWTGVAVRLAGMAQGRAQFHQGLIVVAGTVRRKISPHLITNPPLHIRPPHVLPHAVEARGDPVYVAVHRRYAQPKGDAADRARRVGPHARQGQKPFIARGEGAAMRLHHRLRRFLQVARTAVVPQPLPGLEHLLLRGPGQVRHGGKQRQETRVIGFHGFRAGLLKHDFRQPDAVGIAGVTPGQIAPDTVVPGEQRFADGHGILSFRLLCYCTTAPLIFGNDISKKRKENRRNSETIQELTHVYGNINQFFRRRAE